jgi:hypothetical protein
MTNTKKLAVSALIAIFALVSFSQVKAADKPATAIHYHYLHLTILSPEITMTLLNPHLNSFSIMHFSSKNSAIRNMEVEGDHLHIQKVDNNPVEVWVEVESDLDYVEFLFDHGKNGFIDFVDSDHGHDVFAAGTNDTGSHYRLVY